MNCLAEISGWRAKGEFEPPERTTGLMRIGGRFLFLLIKQRVRLVKLYDPTRRFYIRSDE